jgi:hypothetical protein
MTYVWITNRALYSLLDLSIYFQFYTVNWLSKCYVIVACFAIGLSFVSIHQFTNLVGGVGGPWVVAAGGGGEVLSVAATPVSLSQETVELCLVGIFFIFNPF